jgi:tRNA pseudouridine55 synthase
MDGVLIIDKPAGITSHDVVSRVRRKLGTKRVGHTGTLDPFATGVMVILVGRATRLAQFLDKDEKEYEAIVQFGFETDTGDLTGTILTEPGEVAAGFSVSKENWEPILDQFRGDIKQVPPMYSAKKIDGKKLYERARKGEIIERDPITVSISTLELIAPLAPASERIRIRVVCSAGTYIRTLAEDIGRAIGVGAHLMELRRTRAGRFGLSDAIALEAFEQMQTSNDRLLPVRTAVEHLKVFKLDAERAGKTRNGLSTGTDQIEFAPGEPVRMMGPEGDLVAVGFFDPEENSIRPKVVLV